MARPVPVDPAVERVSASMSEHMTAHLASTIAEEMAEDPEFRNLVKVLARTYVESLRADMINNGTLRA